MTFWQIDFPVFLMAALAGTSCALLGSFLLLRREVMLGDALSHAVLPGLALGYLATGLFSPPIMMLGALLACGFSVQMTRVIRSCAGLDQGTSMGISFTFLFAVGVVLIEKFVGSRVHLDVEHALYGAIELTYWPIPGDLYSLPPEILFLGLVACLIIAFVFIFSAPLKALCFDPDYAKLVGLSPSVLMTVLYILTVVVIVASFQAVGAILVIALLTGPAATARLFCNSLQGQLLASAIFGMLCGVGGYLAAGFLPLWLGADFTLSAAGMIAVISALLFTGVYFAREVLSSS